MFTSGNIIKAYGSIVLIGGLIGYLTAGSLPSLFAGGLSGLALIFLGQAASKQKSIAVTLSVLLTLMLTGFFSYRFTSTGVFMPSGLMLIVSGVTLFPLTRTILSKKNKMTASSN